MSNYRAREQRKVNLGHNTFKTDEFNAIMNAVPFETSKSREKLMTTQERSPAKVDTADNSILEQAHSAYSVKGINNFNNRDNSKRSYPDFLGCKKPVGHVGWGMNL